MKTAKNNLKPLTPAEQAILLIDRTIRDLQLRRAELAATLPADEAHGRIIFKTGRGEFEITPSKERR
jgi:hypothetical protein